MDFEPEVEANDRERVALDAEHTVGVVKAPKPSYQKYYTENGIVFLCFPHSITCFMFLYSYLRVSILMSNI